MIDRDARREETAEEPGKKRTGQGITTGPMCGARLRGSRKGGECRRPAGWGTDHVGYGRCRLHGGTSPSLRLKAYRDMARARWRRRSACRCWSPVPTRQRCGISAGASSTACANAASRLGGSAWPAGCFTRRSTTSRPCRAKRPHRSLNGTSADARSRSSTRTAEARAKPQTDKPKPVRESLRHLMDDVTPDEDEALDRLAASSSSSSDARRNATAVGFAFLVLCANPIWIAVSLDRSSKDLAGGRLSRRSSR